MVPTKDRNHLATALEYEGNLFLFDCGENTQKQIKIMKLPIGKIKKIFISHWHGDHVLGLPGLIQTLTNVDSVDKIEIHGPINSKKYVDHMLKSSIFESKIPINVFEHIPKENEVITILENQDYEINCAKLNHSVPCIGYSFKKKDSLNVDTKKAKELGIEKSPLLSRIKMGIPIEIETDGEKRIIKPEDITYPKKGLKISFVFDTRPCKEIDLLVKDSDYLVMEATYIYETHAHKAEEYDHMSAKETAQIALDNNVGTLLITHFSQRYKDIKDIEAEAKETFENTISAYDYFSYNIK